MQFTPHCEQLIVDLTDVEFLASAAMNLLVVAHREITPTARFGVVADGPGTSRPMGVIGIDDVVALYRPSVRRLVACRPR